MNPVKNTRDAVRAAFLPLDCPRESLEALFRNEPEALLTNADRFEQYVRTGLAHVNITPQTVTGINTVQELVTFPAVTPLRIQHADPLVGTKYETREPEQSAERRMLQQPLLKHPGLTWFELNAREYYIATLTDFFEQELPTELQSEIAAVLLAPDSADSTKNTDYQTYTETDSEAVHQRYKNRVEITDNGDIRIPSDHISRCCQLLQKSESQIGHDYPERLSYVEFKRGGFEIPQKQFRLHLAEYAWHAWGKLVSIAYNTLTSHDLTRLVTATPNVDEDLFTRFQSKSTVFIPYYGTTNTENPKRNWTTSTDSTLANHSIEIEDKRLITVIDCIRANTDLEFGKPIRINTLFDRIRTFFPAPHRPGNDIGTKETLRNALQAAANDQFRVFNHSNSNALGCTIPAPKPSPYHPRMRVNPWKQYLATLAKQSQAKRGQQVPNRHRSQGIRPVLPRKYSQAHLQPYETQLTHAQRTAVTTQPAVTALHDTEPLVDAESFQRLTCDEVVFLTRISLAMERLLNNASLTRSMRPLRYDADGNELQINEAKLIDDEWLEKHTEGTDVLYTVPYRKRRDLGIENISHDGYGEKTPSEKSLHRKGVDYCAAALAAKPDVTRVIRYCDLWRLRATSCEPALADQHLFSTRVDVIAFNGTTPKYAVGVETASNAASKSQRCVQKLSALSETIETWFITPNSQHLWRVMNHLNDPNHLDFKTFPDSTADSYGRSNWERELIAEEFLGEYFDTLHTYRSLNTEHINAGTNDHQHKIVGHV